MRWIPDSLAARTVLLVIAVLAVAEFATLSIVSHHRKAAHLDQAVRLITGQIRLLQAILPTLEPTAKQRFIIAENDGQERQLILDDGSAPPDAAKFGFARRLAAGINQQLDQPVLLRFTKHEPRQGLWVGFMADQQRWWLILPPLRLEPQDLPHELWLALGCALLAVIIVAGLFVRSIVKPLARLGEAVEATGDGRMRSVTPEGPKEVRRLAERHNLMLTQLADIETERREMIAGLTHDLRAPLARLRVRLALLDNDLERAGLARDIDDMERIVGQCLAFLRSDEAPSEAPAALLIADAVSDDVASQRELGRLINMRVSEAAASAQVVISHAALRRVLDNLIENAWKYGAPPVEIELSLEADLDGVANTNTTTPKKLCLCVRDHGQGIAIEQREHALEAFVQIDPARSTNGSCGLGLAIVRRIVQSCAGSLSLNAAAQGGLEVRIVFPVQPIEPSSKSSAR